MKVVNKNKVLVIGIISLIMVNIGLLIYQKYTDKETNIPKVKLKDQEKKKDAFAIMLEQSDGTYQATDSKSFNQPGYTFNSEKSGLNGNKIENALSYNDTTKAVVVNVNSTSYCYVYFDLKPNDGATQLIESGELWESGLEGDGYRYTGTNPDNYICFGTKDKSTCTGNTDAYMYRIIGVFPDSEGNQHMKLIKKEAINTTLSWHFPKSIVHWESSELYNDLNGSTYLTNATYMPTGWSDRITKWKWSAVVTDGHSGPSYYSITTKQIYLHELNRSGKPSGGSWTTPIGKIGLMYISDYLMSLGSSALSYTSESNFDILKKGWMYLWNSNNDGEAPSSWEWTISCYSANSLNSYSWSWCIYNDGSVDSDEADMGFSVRPTLYLNSNQVIQSGSGTISDPFLLS